MSAHHLLVIDDDDSIREIAQLALEIIGGWKVSTACCGREGLSKAIADRPDAVLLDVMMPEMDGRATIGEFRADPQTRDIPVILLTAKVQAGDLRGWNDLALAGVIAKPFDPMTLASQIADLLAWQE